MGIDFHYCHGMVAPYVINSVIVAFEDKYAAERSKT